MTEFYVSETRPEGWPEMLHAFCMERRSRAFEWGVNDCALQTSDWVMKLTGFDPARSFRGTYSSEFGAAKALLKLGAGDLFSTYDRELGVGSVPRAVRRGDAVGFDGQYGQALGICVGGDLISTGPDGFLVAAMSRAIRVWSLGA
jgi:hypothetical protein